MARPIPHGSTTAVRVFLAVTAVLTLALGPMVHRQWPDAWDPMGARILLATTCLLALAGTWTQRLRDHASTLALGAAILNQGWFLHVSHVNGMIVERTLNAVMMLVVAIVFCRHMWQAAVFLAVTVVGIAWGYVGPGADDIPQFVVQTVAVVIGVGTVIALNYRRQLEEALAGQVAHAEALALEVGRRRHAEQEALEASRAKSAFLAHMSHELRTPLTAILGYGELVHEELEGTEVETLRPDVDRILSSGRHLLGLIDDVLDLARIESGKVELRTEEVLLTDLVQGCARLVRPAASAQGTQLAIELPDDLVVMADEARLRQVLLNLLSNAIKFTEKGHVTVHARIDEALHLTVRDNGCGIAADALPTLFDPFVMVGGDRRRQQGTGLGLAICRELTERMGGTLQVESEVGVGSAFTVSLPDYRLSQSTTSTV